MYLAYFVNVNTGKLLVTHRPQDNPCNVFYPAFNVNGWSAIGEDLYNLLSRVAGYSYVTAIEEHI